MSRWQEALAMLERHWRGVLLVGVMLRVGAMLVTSVFPLVANTWDSTFYQETAVTLADRGTYAFQGKPTALYPPGYPVVLSGAYRLLGSDVRVGQAVGVLASLILLWGTAALTRRFAGARAARRTVVLMAIDPTQIVMPAFLMSEAVCAALLAVGLVSLCAATLGPRRALLLIAVLALTLAGFTRGHAFLIAPAVLLVLAASRRMPVRVAILAAAAVLLVNGIALGLWAQRNDRVLGEPVLLATNGAMNLLLGNNANANGGRADPPGGVPQTGNELEDQRLSRERALEFIRRNPIRTLFLMPVKAARLWVAAPLVTYRAELRAKWGSAPALVVLVLAQGFHVLLWVGALMALRRRRPVGKVWFAAVAMWTLGHLPFLGGARYLFPVWFLAHAATASLAEETGPTPELTPASRVPSVPVP